MATLLQDLRYGFRMLARNPAFTAVAVLALALGIGANTAIFSLVNAYLLKLLPYPDSGRLVLCNQQFKREGMPGATAFPNYLDWRAQNHVFTAMAAVRNESFNLTGDGEPERVTGARLSASAFQVFQMQPLLGRGFLEEEDRPGARRVAVLGKAMWEKRYGGRRDIIGRQIQINGEPYTVVGVMPAGFRLGTMDYNISIPLALDPAKFGRGIQFLRVVARLKPGVTIERAQAEMSAIAARLEREYPENRDWTAGIGPLTDWYVGRRIRPSLLVLLAAVSLVLLIACVNVANLLLARAASRSKEMSIRTALGAGRWRIARQMLAESLLLCAAGGAAGLLFGYWGSKAMYAAIPVWMLPFRTESINPSILGFTVLATLVTGLLFGMAPALVSSRADVNEALKEGGRGTPGGPRRGRLRNALVIAELALAVMLLTGSGLLVKSFIQLQHVDLGFQPDHLLTLDVVLSRKAYPTPDLRRAFYRQLIDRASAQPGVVSAAAISSLPLNGNINDYGVTIEGRPALPGEQLMAGYQTISSEYFRTMRIPLLKGRAFTTGDNGNSLPVVIIDETMAKQFWPNQDPIGKRMKLGTATSPEAMVTVIGVVGKVLSVSPEEAPKAMMYFPYLQDAFPLTTLVVRTAGDPLGALPGVKRALRELNPALPPANIATMEEMVADSSAYRRLTMYVIAGFAALALALAAVGLYGVISYSVAQRGHELGIRMALGAQPADVLRLVVGQGLALTAAGTALGLGAAYALTRFLASMLFGVKPRDPLTFAAVALVLAVVATAAAYIPARRATRVDPLTALRYE